MLHQTFRLCEPARPFFQCAKKCLRVFTTYTYTGSREKPKRKIKLQKPRKDLTHFFGEWVPCLTSDVSREPVLCSRWFVEYAMWAACSLVAHFLLPATASVGRRLQLHACRVLAALSTLAFLSYCTIQAFLDLSANGISNVTQSLCSSVPPSTDNDVVVQNY